MGKRIILSLDEEVLEKLDFEWKRIGFPSRNSYITQCVRYVLGMDNVFEEVKG